MLLGQKAQGQREHKPREGRGVEVAGLVEGLSGKKGGAFTLWWEDRMGVEKNFPNP